MLLALYSYFMIVELHPRQPTIIEYVVWGWSATLWIEEIRQVSVIRCSAFFYHATLCQRGIIMLSSCTRVSVRPSQAGVVSKRLNESAGFRHRSYHTVL